MRELMARLDRIEKTQAEIQKRLERLENEVFSKFEEREVPKTGPRSWAEATKDREMQDWKERIREWDQVPPEKRRTSWSNAMYDNLIEPKRKETQEWDKKMRRNS